MSVTWAAAADDRLRVYFQDSMGGETHTSFHIAHAASDGSVQAFVNSLQTLSDLSITKYERTNENVAAGMPPAATFGSGYSYATLTNALRLEFKCAAGQGLTRGQVVGPKEAYILVDAQGRQYANPAQTQMAIMAAAAVGVVTNNAGDPVVQLKFARGPGKWFKRL